MKYDTAAIDKGTLMQAVNAAYPLALDRLAFLPLGEEGYSYLGEAPNERKVLVKAYAPSPLNLERAFEAIAYLHEARALHEIVSPLRTQTGAFTFQFAGFHIAVFPFIEGETWWDAGLNDGEWLRLADFTARFHQTADPEVSLLPIEDYTVPFQSDLLGVVRSLDEPSASPTPYQARLGELLKREGDDLLQTIRRFEGWAEQLRAREVRLALTHGDPTAGNVMKDREGRLFIIDWGDIALGPPERDLVHFTGSRFEPFLERYAKGNGTLRLHPEIFRFYLYRWSLQEIADYGHRILHLNTTEAEDEHCWRELTDYLPLRHDEIEREMAQIEATLQRVGLREG